MINVSDATKQAFLTSSTQKTIYIEFPNKNMVLSNEDIISESFELKQALEDDRNLTFKGCIASQVKFQAAEIAEDLRGELMTVSIQAGNTETIKLFTGYVESQSNLTQEDFVTNIVAYDAFQKISKLTIEDFSSRVNLSGYGKGYWFYFDEGIGSSNYGFRRILKYLDDNYGVLGYNENSAYYNNLIESTWDTFVEESEEISGSLRIRKNLLAAVNGTQKLIDVMRYLCQSIGVYGYIDGNGLLNFKKLEPFNKATYPGQNTIPANDLYPAGENTEIIFEQSDYFEASYEPYNVEKIVSLLWHYESGRTIILFGSSLPPNVKLFNYGASDFYLAPLPNRIDTILEIYLNTVLRRINEIEYKPSMIKVVGRPWVQIGDSYLYTTRKNIIRSYVLKRTLKGIQSLFDTYEAEGEDIKDNEISGNDSGTNINTSSLNVGSSSKSGNLIVNGHEVTFKDITISGTTYHLLGYTD